MIAHLPPLPVDDVSLGLYLDALEGSRSSVRDVLRMFAELAGADLGDDCQDPELRDPCYHPNDLLRALLLALREARSE